MKECLILVRIRNSICFCVADITLTCVVSSVSFRFVDTSSTKIRRVVIASVLTYFCLVFRFKNSKYRCARAAHD